MTIPTRPAPVPPQMRSSAAADANSSIEQLRLQLQQHQLQQQQKKLTIKLPPPPKGGTSGNHITQYPHKTSNFNNNNELDNATSTSSITRKFPKARYAPTTNWDDTPFDPFASTLKTNGNFKKVPPPRPPPPKVLVNGSQKPNNSSSSAPTNMLSNLFHRKKTNNSRNNAKQQSAARIYGLSSGNYAVNANSTTNYDSTATSITTKSSSSVFTNWDLNAAWNSTANSYASASTISTSTATTSSSQNQQEAQLISFDSPPSSPTFTQKSNSDCVSVDSFSSDSNFSSPQNGSVSQPESGFEDDFSATSRSRPATTSPLDPWESFSGIGTNTCNGLSESVYCSTATIGTAPVRNLNRSTAANQDNPLCNGRNLLPPAPSVSMPTIIKPKISQKPKAPHPPVFGLPKQRFNGALSSDLPTPPSPPMPQYSPPPPPPALTTGNNVSILDVISGKADAIHLSTGATGYDDVTFCNETPYGIALYDFDGSEEGDLSFRENEKIYLLERVSEDWYRGRTRAGCEGILPVNYIEIKVPLTAEVPPKDNANNSYNLSKKSSMPKVRCLYNFPAEVEGDLELKENDMVTILYRINEDWLFGEINNKQGQFPANFLEYIPVDIPLP